MVQAVQPCVHVGRQRGRSSMVRGAMACVPTAQVAAGRVPGWWRCRGLPELFAGDGPYLEDPEDPRGEGEEELGEDEDDVGLAFPEDALLGDKEDDVTGAPQPPPGRGQGLCLDFLGQASNGLRPPSPVCALGPFPCCPQPLVDSNLGP